MRTRNGRPTRSLERSRSQAVLILLAALALAALSIRTGIAAYYREDDPERALALAPNDARALMFRAEGMLIGGGTPDLPGAAQLARRALQRDTTLGTPYRILGFEAEQRGDGAAAERLIGDAGKLSRRDLAAELWLINRSVARDDVPGALQNFDVALRASTLAAPILMPVLSQALAEPRIVDQLAPRLLKAPWSAQFLTEAIATSKSLPGLVRLAGRLQRLNAPLGPENMRQLVNRLVEEHAFALVRLLRPITAGQLPPGQYVNDPEFDRPGALPNFVWTLGTTDGIDIIRKADDGQGGHGIGFGVEGDRAGEIARQLLTLSPGRYRLSIIGQSNVTDGSQAPTWSVTCADVPLALLHMEMVAGRSRLVGGFDVPPACAGQLLVLVAKPGAQRHATGSVDRVEIVRG